MNHFKILKEFQGCLSIQLSKICITQTQYLSGVLSLICYRLPRRLVYNIIRHTHCQQLFSNFFKKFQKSSSAPQKRLQIPSFSLYIKIKNTAKGVFYFLAHPKGFEPPFSRIGICCVIQLRHGWIFSRIFIRLFIFN